MQMMNNDEKELKKLFFFLMLKGFTRVLSASILKCTFSSFLMNFLTSTPIDLKPIKK